MPVILAHTEQDLPIPKNFKFKHEFDQNGILFYYGTNSYNH